jgi:REP element-mobilizing transposase RayT
MNRPYDGRHQEVVMSRDPDRPNRRSIRLRHYDYSNAGAYFVTIVIKDRECLLGEIVDDGMHLNEIGQFVGDVWDCLPGRYPGVDLDAFVIMPNHVHGIIVITPDAQYVASVGAVHEPPLQSSTQPFPPPPDPAWRLERRQMLLPKIIGYFKMNTAKRANLIREMPGAPFWQRNYYEHVIRNAADLERLREYIECNPLRWALDQVHPDNPSQW